MRLIMETISRAAGRLFSPGNEQGDAPATPAGPGANAGDGPGGDAPVPGLALYEFRSCPFCLRVRREIARLGVTIESRDTQRDPGHRAALQAGGGRTMVPCLRISRENGEDQWLYESADIIQWLRANVGHESTGA